MTSTNPTMATSIPQAQESTVNAQRAAVKIAANLASGTVPRESSRSALPDQLGVRKPRRRRGRSEESRALAEQVMEP